MIVQCKDDPYRGSNSRENWDFGKEIIIERMIQKTGASAFKIMTEDRTVVSTKKEDLMKILQHFNYQIENPVHVLSQKDAKTLLQSATKKSFYDFFFEATRLKNAYDLINENKHLSEQLMEIINTKEKKNADWEHNIFTPAKEAYDSMVDARRLNEEKFELARELAWAEVHDKKRTVKKWRSKAEVVEEEKRSLHADLEQSDRKIEQHNAVLQNLSLKIVETNKATPEINERKAAIEHTIKEQKEEYNKLNFSRNELQTQNTTLEKDIELLEQEIQSKQATGSKPAKVSLNALKVRDRVPWTLKAVIDRFATGQEGGARGRNRRLRYAKTGSRSTNRLATK